MFSVIMLLVSAGKTVFRLVSEGGNDFIEWHMPV